MTQRPGISFSHDFAARGRNLAEQRLAYLTELYDSGRWARYFGEADFLANVREAKAAVDAWRRLEPATARPEPLPAGSETTPFLVPAGPVADADLGTPYLRLEDFIDRDGWIERPSALDAVGPELDEHERDALESAAPEIVEIDPVEPEPVASPPSWLRRSRLPPVAFSPHGIGAESDLSEA